MATSNENNSNSRPPYSQSFRTHSTQNALAEIAPSARMIPNEESGQGPPLTKSVTAPVTNLEENSSVSATNIEGLSEENLHHRLNATGSVQAIVVEDDVLFAGLQGGEIVVSFTAYDTILRQAD